MSNQKLRSVRRALKKQKIAKVKPTEKQREYLPGEVENNLISMGLLEGDTLEAYLIQQLINYDHGEIIHQPRQETVQETLNSLGLGDIGTPAKQLHNVR